MLSTAKLIEIPYIAKYFEHNVAIGVRFFNILYVKMLGKSVIC